MEAVGLGWYLAVNQKVTTDIGGCPRDCRACGSTSTGSLPPGTFAPSRRVLSGPRFVLACLYVFVLPLAALIATQVWLADRHGELPAAALGVGISVLLLLPAARKLRRTAPEEGSHDTL